MIDRHTCPYRIHLDCGENYHGVECDWYDQMRFGNPKCNTCGWYPAVEERRKEKLMKGKSTDESSS